MKTRGLKARAGFGNVTTNCHGESQKVRHFCRPLEGSKKFSNGSDAAAVCVCGFQSLVKVKFFFVFSNLLAHVSSVMGRGVLAAQLFHEGRETLSL